MEDLGKRIRVERRLQRLSLKELAEKVGISTMTLQRIETGKTSPSVSVLAEIGHQLLKPIDFFLAKRDAKAVVIRKDEQPVISSPKMYLTIIAPPGMIEENILVNLGEAREGAFIDEHTEEGRSLVYIMEGSCIFEHDGDKHELCEGDTVYYDARFPHSVTATSERHRFLSIFLKGK